MLLRGLQGVYCLQRGSAPNRDPLGQPHAALLPTNLTSSESKRELARVTEKRDIPKGNGVKRVRYNEVA